MPSAAPTKTAARLGAKIRQLRRQESLSQVQLAERLAISPSYLNLIEANKRPLTAPLLIRLAHPRGVKTMNVVRRDSLFGELKALGADACVVDGPNLADAVKAHTREAQIRLGLDAVSGRATARLSACVGEGGVVCNYGSMTGEDPVIPRAALTFRGQTLAGFMLGRALATRSRERVQAIYADLGRQILDGTLSAPVEKVYPIEEIKAALTHAQQGEPGGKILVTPNGPL